jgi:hypothetical protein
VVDVGGLGAVDVDLGRPDLVDRLDPDRVRAADAQRRREMVAVDHVGDDLAAGHGADFSLRLHMVLTRSMGNCYT